MEMEIHPSIFEQKIQHLASELRHDHLGFDWTNLLNAAEKFTEAFENFEKADKTADEALDEHNLQLELEAAAAEQDTSTQNHKLRLRVAHQQRTNIINTLLPTALEKAGGLKSTAQKLKRRVHDLLAQVDTFRKEIDDL
ncbi:uncharacterized protein LACBIDRAFT_330653 [Laccaria bicolor S238N-H82]|uniref:Predicted protein n=1 Tax=Laccaria bicolor (strain S238N-H82 / ATCC MYA-4686) TaxID=486041 RepID=B0DM12_LACBS|nr:uncharacterized protein LACBIDRAFT_330653 [Laccaria bicolor S238N-H82]EDR04393.1 predicted protein [Laccaria bicolor S238N-H82]|eukprot:XP_001884912.1 predicted protein [Laccaria bicolor S238N-H82]